MLTGRVADANGPWVAEQLLELGVELAHITICGDRPADIEAQLRFLAAEGVDLIITTGGLGPTADDMTVATVARFCGRPLVPTPRWKPRSPASSKRAARFPGVDADAVQAANRKQAMVPDGATVLDPVGTAPEWWFRADPPSWCCRAPKELQAMWPAAIASAVLRSRRFRAGPTTGRRRCGCSLARIGSGRHVAGRGDHSGLRRSGDHHPPTARRVGDGHPVRAG